MVFRITRQKHYSRIHSWQQKRAADCLSRLPFVTRKRSDNPLNNMNCFNEPITELTHTSMLIDCIRPEENDAMYRLCEIDLTDTIAHQKTDRHCIRIENLMKNKDSKFPNRDKYAKEEGLLYHINQENGKEYKAAVVPKALVPTVLKETHDRFGHFDIGKTYSLIKRCYLWPKMIKKYSKAH